MTAKPATERMAALRKRRQEAGLTRLELWLHPDDREAAKEAAAKLQRKRDKTAKVAPNAEVQGPRSGPVQRPVGRDED